MALSVERWSVADFFFSPISLDDVDPTNEVVIAVVYFAGGSSGDNADSCSD